MFVYFILINSLNHLTFSAILLIIIFVDFCICVEKAKSSNMAVTPDIERYEKPFAEGLLQRFCGYRAELLLVLAALSVRKGGCLNEQS